MKTALKILGIASIILLVAAAVVCFVTAGELLNPQDTTAEGDDAATVAAVIVGTIGAAIASILLGVLFLIFGIVFIVAAIMFLPAFIRDMRGKNSKPYCIFLLVVSVAALIAVIVLVISSKSAAGLVFAVPAVLIFAYSVLSIIMQSRKPIDSNPNDGDLPVEL